jgi:hypothetical protein
MIQLVSEEYFRFIVLPKLSLAQSVIKDICKHLQFLFSRIRSNKKKDEKLSDQSKQRIHSVKPKVFNHQIQQQKISTEDAAEIADMFLVGRKEARCDLSED